MTDYELQLLLTDYEIRSRKWIGKVSWKWAQRLVSRYIKRMVHRKFTTWKDCRAVREKLRPFMGPCVIERKLKSHPKNPPTR